jgi:hypothetical protein
VPFRVSSNRFIPFRRLVKKGNLTDNNKLFLQRVHYLSNLNQSVSLNKVSDMFLSEKTQKKMFFPNIFMNSEEFKDLGTLHYERRNGESYDHAQTDAISQS